ncbi:MAG TPA: CYTH domain-containing protein [Candidatus Aenigmarchaeota archaeon]|nr:CYTH domain-containing protein [Candidatus Aenigmarchaeota archaeon]
MTEYESEVRFFIEDIGEFKRNLSKLNAKTIYGYEFSDHYFKPRKIEWNPLYKTIRLREWFKPKRGCEVIFNRVEIVHDEIPFKRSLYPEGKIILYRGDFDLCSKFLTDLEFEEWFTIEKKNCELVEVPKPNFKLVYEQVKGLGWIGELETSGKDPKKVKENFAKWLSVLKVRATYKPLSIIYAEKMGLL